MQESVIVNKLNTARKQLPIETPSLIFLKIPENWHKQTDAQKILDESIVQFFRNTARVVAVGRMDSRFWEI